MDDAMKRKPSTEATAAWIRLMRIQSRVLDAVEQDLKKAGFPPLAWYDALLELSRAPSGEMRPVELEKQMLIRNTRLAADRPAGGRRLAARRECKIDKRGQFVEITEAGVNCRRKCGARIPPRSKSTSARNCRTPMRQSCAACWTGSAARAMRRPCWPPETPRRRDDIIFTSSVRGSVCPQPLPTPRAFGRSAFDPEFVWRVTRSI